MAKLFVSKQGVTVNLGMFLSEFTQGRRKLTNKGLQLLSQWEDSIKQEGGFEEPTDVSLPQGGRGLLGSMPNAPGVYTIYGKGGRRSSGECFYVGMSTSNIRGRIQTHLRDDAKENNKRSPKRWRNKFHMVSKYKRLFICYAECTKGKPTGEAFAQSLELLEMFLTVSLKPKLLTEIANGGRR